MSEDRLPMRGDLKKSWERLLFDQFYRYKGTVSEKLPGDKLKYHGRTFESIEEFHSFIDGLPTIIQNSIDKGLNKLK